jgi:hypothetical protein
MCGIRIETLPDINNLCFQRPRYNISSTIFAGKWKSGSMQVAVTEERVVVFPLSENERDVGSVDSPDRQAEPDITSGKTN